MRVARTVLGYSIEGYGPDVDLANRYLTHLETRNFPIATIRTYAFHVLSFLRFAEERGLDLVGIVPTDLFDFLEWLGARPTAQTKVVSIGVRLGAAPSTMNQRIAAVRGLFEYAVICGVRPTSPVPISRRSSGLAVKPRGLLGHVSNGRPRGGGHLVRERQRLLESLDPDEVSTFLADLNTHRDRALTLAMLYGGLRSAEVRSLLLSDVDMGLGRVRVLGKGGRERVVPIDRVFFRELARYLPLRATAGMRHASMLRGSERSHQRQPDD
ncbi:MAG: tyrosine-type recombinase/integrase [Ferrimicrobium sp.]